MRVRRRRNLTCYTFLCECSCHENETGARFIDAFSEPFHIDFNLNARICTLKPKCHETVVFGKKCRGFCCGNCFSMFYQLFQECIDLCACIEDVPPQIAIPGCDIAASLFIQRTTCDCQHLCRRGLMLLVDELILQWLSGPQFSKQVRVNRSGKVFATCDHQSHVRESL